MEDVFIVRNVGDQLYFFDKKRLYAVDKNNGTIETILNYPGEGPDEYKFIIDAVLEDSIIHIYDSGKRGFLKYDYQGNFIDSRRSDSITTFQKMKDGNYSVCYSPYFDNDVLTAIYDKNWQLLRKGVKSERKSIAVNDAI